MFINFFYKLREVGIQVSPTSFLTLQNALKMGLIKTMDDFYMSARSILVKSERYFDLYDQVFAYHFEGIDVPDADGVILDEMAKAMLDQWLQDPKEMAEMLGEDEKKLSQMTPDELIEYFKKRLEDQTERHDGGSKWIGTGGTSPVGHSGQHEGGMRVGGVSRNKSAVKVANERRYKEYSGFGPLTEQTIGEALKRLRNLIPSGPKDKLDIDSTIYETMRNGGEIEIIFEQNLKDKLKIILAIDNGGWSMDPYVHLIQTLFNYSKAQFKDIKTFFFHNTVYDTIWEDSSRFRKPLKIDELTRRDPETRLIMVGDASMAPYELMAQDGSIYASERSGRSSKERLNFLVKTFPHCIWLNPVPKHMWHYTRTIQEISNIFPMFELSLDGLEKGISHLMSK